MTGCGRYEQLFITASSRGWRLFSKANVDLMTCPAAVVGRSMTESSFPTHYRLMANSSCLAAHSSSPAVHRKQTLTALGLNSHCGWSARVAVTVSSRQIDRQHFNRLGYVY